MGNALADFAEETTEDNEAQALEGQVTDQGEGAEQGQAAAGDGSPTAPPTPGERPDFIPEKFWDPKTGEPRIEELAKSQKDFESKWRNREGTKVDDPAGYEFEPPEGTEHLLMQGEDGEEDPMVSGFRDFAHQSGMSQEMFQATVDWYLKSGAELMPAFDPKAEIERMGPKGQETINMLSAKTRQLVDTGVLTDEEKAVFVNMWNSAEAANVMGKILQAQGEQPIPSGGDGGTNTLSDVELDEMYQAVYEDGPYKGQRRYAVDENYRARVDKAYQKRYGKGPAFRSQNLNGR